MFKINFSTSLSNLLILSLGPVKTFPHLLSFICFVSMITDFLNSQNIFLFLAHHHFYFIAKESETLF